MNEHHKYTEKELKELVVKVYDGKTFTSLQCEPNMVTMVFMTTMFLGAPPSEPTRPKLENGSDIKKERKNKLNHLDEMEQWRKDMDHYNKVIYPEWEKNEKPKIDEYIDNIGMLYEDMEKAGPRSVNGYPIFMSNGVMSKEDTKRFIEIFTKYKEKRKVLDNEF